MTKILFVHGWYAAENPFTRERELLHEIFPKADSVEIFRWNSNLDWNEVMTSSNRAAVQLIRFLRGQQVPEEWVLVGHSLGVKIVIQSINQISGQVQRAVLLGAAMQTRPLSILTSAASHSLKEIWNVYNSNDRALQLYQWVQGHEALGSTPPHDFPHFRNLAVPAENNFVNAFSFPDLLGPTIFGMGGMLTSMWLQKMGLLDFVQHGSERYLQSLLKMLPQINKD